MIKKFLFNKYAAAFFIGFGAVVSFALIFDLSFHTENDVVPNETDTRVPIIERTAEVHDHDPIGHSENSETPDTQDARESDVSPEMTQSPQSTDKPKEKNDSVMPSDKSAAETPDNEHENPYGIVAGTTQRMSDLPEELREKFIQQTRSEFANHKIPELRQYPEIFAKTVRGESLTREEMEVFLKAMVILNPIDANRDQLKAFERNTRME